MTKPGGNLLGQAAGEAASAVARAHLDDAAAAAARFANHEDTEALHDFRVAIRRLRVTIKAYAVLESGMSKKQRRRLRKLARATNPGRDAEVQIAWFRERAGSFTPAQRASLEKLRARLRARRRREITRTDTKLRRRFTKLERTLRSRLDALPGSDRAMPPFRSIAGPALRRHAAALHKRLSVIRSWQDGVQLHAARIAAKRLRYLLEPLEDVVPSGSALLRLLKNLQDLLGQLTDAHVLEREIDAADGSERGAGVTAAVRRLRTESAALFARVRTEWLAGGGAELQRQIDAAATEIARDGVSGRSPIVQRRSRRTRVPR